ncbi:MAG: DUF1003 domain-containing protein [Bacteroidetes bacterium]|nr:DUF1003 domain-containing protein [Bacteroidota bacterium]
MENSTDYYAKKLSETANERLRELHKLVTLALEEEELLTRQLLEAEKQIKTTRAERIADKVASFGGSWRFIISFSVIIVIWIALNTFVLAAHPFDPYPFILLNLILSCIAALQAPVIMMSQNRKEERDRRRAENDYLVNLKAEIEIRSLHKKIDLLLEDQYQSLFESQSRQLELIQELSAQIAQLKNRIH